jgi:methyltransferase (TIGR00027 family)
VCVARACSFNEHDAHRHSGDWVAVALLPPFLRVGSRLGPFRRLWSRLAAEGMYQWVIARTRYIDDVFANVAPSVAQVLIMGAGYDSRAIRFADQLRAARVFELDAPAPQADKRSGLEHRKLTVPDNLTFVAVDFETDSVAERLAQAGFVMGTPTLFLLEGLTMYLEPETVGETFRLIAETAGPSSVVVFDYAYAAVVAGGRTEHGAAGVTESVARFGEPWRFGIERGRVGEFLAPYGFTIADEASPETLEKRYFTDQSGRRVGRVNGTQALVTARKTG